MRKVLERLGLIVNLVYKTGLSIANIKSQLQDDSQDKKLLWIDNLIGYKRLLRSNDIVFSDNTFKITKKGILNPLSGRGQISGEIIENQHEATSIQCEISSNLNELWFILFSAIFLMILWIPFILIGDFNFVWLLYFCGFFTFIIIGTIYFQRYEVRKLQSDLNLFFKRLEPDNSANVK